MKKHREDFIHMDLSLAGRFGFDIRKFDDTPMLTMKLPINMDLLVMELGANPSVRGYVDMLGRDFAQLLTTALHQDSRWIDAFNDLEKSKKK
jgi:hypothetical protein